MDQRLSPDSRVSRRLGRRDFLKTTIAAGSAALLAACAPAAPPAPPSSAPAGTGAAPGQAKESTLQFWSWLNPADTNPRAVVQTKLIAAFEKSNPGVKVNVQVVDWRTIPQQLLQATAAGQGPDRPRRCRPCRAEGRMPQPASLLPSGTPQAGPRWNTRSSTTCPLTRCFSTMRSMFSGVTL